MAKTVANTAKKAVYWGTQTQMILIDVILHIVFGKFISKKVQGIKPIKQRGGRGREFHFVCSSRASLCI